MANFTPEQEQAIFTHDKNLIVVAGAGSGKTRVLVERYLTLLEKNRDWPLNALVAITFTREAAQEMRDRVRKELEASLKNATNESDRRHWSQMLGQMDSARIDTIHGLCATILRANAAEAGIDPRFEVLEGVNAIALLEDLITMELHALSEYDGADIAPLFTEYDMREIREILCKPDLLAADLGELPTDAKALFEQWQAEWIQTYYDAQERLQKDAIFTEAGDYIPPSSVPENDTLVQKWAIIDKIWDDIFSEEIALSQQAIIDVREAGIRANSGAKSKWPDEDELIHSRELIGYIRDSLKAFEETVGAAPEESDYRAAKMTIRWYHLLERIQDAYRQAKKEKSYLDFNDLEILTAKLLSEKQAVRERYQGQEFKHLLVDEFQDTNSAQWDIARYLANPDDDTALFLVGDPKQSIYAFRGADVSVFDHVKDAIGKQTNGQELGLTVSFRSHPGLIDAFNKLFAVILVRDESSSVADFEIKLDAPMSAFRTEQPDLNAQKYGSIELLLQRNYHWKDPASIPSDKRRVWEAYEIAQRLLKLRQDEAPIFDKDMNEIRPYDFGDTAILFQSTSHITTYEKVFKALKIPFATVAGRGYYDRQEVWDVLNLLKALHNPHDNLSLAAALRSPMFSFSDDILYALRLILGDDAKPIPLWEALNQPDIDYISGSEQQKITFARNTLYELHEFAGRVTISELLRQALAKTGYLAALTGLPNGSRLRRNVEKLLDIAENSGKITLGAFARYLNDLTDREVREGEAALDTTKAVRLMTVHASKGLEFPVVVLADTSWSNPRRGTEYLLYDSHAKRLACKIYDEQERRYINAYPYQQATDLQKLREDAERKRLLYVAATRARDCLIISGEVIFSNTAGWHSRGWLSLILESLNLVNLDEIPDGHIFAYTDESALKIWLPEYQDDLHKTLLGTEGSVAWQDLAIKTDALMPARMMPFTMAQEAMMGHLAATQLADIGGHHYAKIPHEKDYYRNNLKRQVFDDTSAQIREAVRTHEPKVSARQIGDMVHEALRYWRFPDDENIEAILRSYAWQHHITHPLEVDYVIQEAHNLLLKFQTSKIYQELLEVKENGLAFYPELPFIFRTEKRIIHGVIDVLYQNKAGEWVILDYKTSTVRPQQGVNLDDAVVGHTRRYHLQVGAYASAVSQELDGLIPRVKIHYIQYTKTVNVPTEIWQAEIKKLEYYIGELFGEDGA
jgi:ATP-dependent helicase/nuclease subunit A